jgi:hypothetical protein
MHQWVASFIECDSAAAAYRMQIVMTSWWKSSNMHGTQLAEAALLPGTVSALPVKEA